MPKKSPHHAVKLDKIIDPRFATKLADAGIDRVHHIRKMTDAELKALPGIGAKAVEAIREVIPA